MAIKIKICGMKYPENTEEVAKLEPDYLGFIFYDKSKRYVLDAEGTAADGASPDSYREQLISRLLNLEFQIQKVGVFVNEDIKKVIRTATEFDMRLVQLHGDESPEYCENLRLLDFQVIKAFGVDNEFDFAVLNEYQDYCDYYLFDTKTGGYGGSGQQFDWNLLKQYNNYRPVFLSGGLDVQDIPTIHDLLKDVNIHALDFNSKLEVEPGRKDVGKCRQAVEAIRNLPENNKKIR